MMINHQYITALTRTLVTGLIIASVFSCASNQTTTTPPAAASTATTTESKPAASSSTSHTETKTKPEPQSTPAPTDVSQAIPPPKQTPIPKTNLRADQHVLLFPTNAVFDSNSGQWKLDVHGWVYEPEPGSIWRNTLIRSLAYFVHAEKDTPDGDRFEQRTAMFLVDNKSDRTIVLSAAQKYLSSPKTGANGHFEFSTTLNPGKSKCNDWLDVKIITSTTDNRKLGGLIQCLPNDGISVISDIDDTIKDSHVLDKKKLLKKTFLKEFQPVKGMSDIYRRWHTKGYRFHYVSSSPWQLYPVLSEFIDKQSYPRGSMHLKLIRVKDKSIFNIFATPEEGKVPTITKLLTTYPKRRFILVGDSGERDANIYADIAKRYPGRIIKIYIRDVRDDKAAVEKIFAGLQKNQWLVFSNPNEILSDQALLNP